jgi:hypothetical protein
MVTDFWFGPFFGVYGAIGLPVTMRHAVVTREGRAGMMRADDLTAPDDRSGVLKIV